MGAIMVGELQTKMELKFAQLIWEHAPISSGELVKLCQETLEWKKSTTYTMLRRLCEKGLFENRDAIVYARISQNEFRALQSKQFVEETFGGSLPEFLTAFVSKKKLSEKEIRELQELIDNMEA